MKRYHYTYLFSLVAAAAMLLGLTAQTPYQTDLVFAVSFTGTPTDQDVEAAKIAVELYNNQNQTDLQVDTPANLKASYLTVLSAIAKNAHSRHQAMAADREHSNRSVRERWILSTPEQRAAALQALAELPAPPPDPQP